MVHHLSPDRARRIALRAQRLTADRPTDLLELITHLTLLPRDLTRAVAPSADLVAWSRLGAAYSPGDLADLAADGAVFDYDATVRPMSVLPLLRAEMAAWPAWEETRDWLAANELFAAEVLDEVDDGPLTAREVRASAQTPWRSSGWNNNRNATMMLRCLAMRGEVVVVGHRGNHPVYDAASRVLPDTEVVPLEEALRERDRQRLRALGLARASGTELPGESIHVRDAGEPAVVDGVPGQWRVDPAYLDDAFAPRTALLSPFDAIVRDRKRLADLFGFDYVLEMYKPAAARRWGYFALPVLHGDRLVGKLDATADHKDGRLFVDAVHEDGRWTRRMRADVDAEIDALAAWLDLPVARGRA